MSPSFLPGFTAGIGSSGGGYTPAVSLWDSRRFAAVALGTLAVIAIGSVSKTMELARGGTAVANMMNGQQVSPDTTDPHERQLLNVVEEMALASGVPVPPVYVMRQEQAINAFAAGHSTSDAVICVSAGCMTLLTRDELQGVIGHEFSHILNGDMRLNLRLMGVLFGIVCLAVIGRVLLQVSGAQAQFAAVVAWLCCSSAGWASSLAASFKPPSAVNENFSPMPPPCSSPAIRRELWAH